MRVRKGEGERGGEGERVREGEGERGCEDERVTGLGLGLGVRG